MLQAGRGRWLVSEGVLEQLFSCSSNDKRVLIEDYAERLKVLTVSEINLKRCMFF